MTEHTIRDDAGHSLHDFPVQTTTDDYAPACRKIIETILQDYDGPFRIRFWDGSEIRSSPGQDSAFALVIRYPAALRAMFRKPVELSLAEAYFSDAIDIEGDLAAAFPLAEYLSTLTIGWLDRLRLASRLRSLPDVQAHNSHPAPLHGQVGSAQRTRDAIRFHYDQPTEFWRLWLDPAMVYSGAWFEDWNRTLEAAQQAKLHKICTKLGLEPGQRLLDMGCGWGGLIIHAAQHRGVHALGITLSEKQADFARQRISELGLETRCRVEVRDLRSFNDGTSYDGVASVGAVEHVREEDLPIYFRTALGALRPGGRFLSQGITRPLTRTGEPLSPFMQRYVFPDSNLIPLHRMLAIAEQQGFETRHVEAMTEHYAHTTRLWYERLGKRRDEAIEIVGRAAYRTFRLMLLGSSYNFTTGAMGLYQVLLAKRS